MFAPVFLAHLTGPTAAVAMVVVVMMMLVMGTGVERAEPGSGDQEQGRATGC